MTTYIVSGQELHVVEKGSPNRQLALLLHGWSSSWYALNPLLGMLSQRFRCMAVDLPGYGQSPPLPKRTTIPDYADLLAEFITRVSDGPIVLIGHSMGGMTSITLALRYPVLVERMVLLSPTITGQLSSYINTVVTPIFLLERFGLGKLLVHTVERAIVGITDRIMRPASFAERAMVTKEDVERLRADMRRPGQARARVECFFAMRENNLSGKLKNVEPPALIIWGAEDNTVPLRDAGVVADEWPMADLRILPKSGHWPQFEAQDTTRRLVAAYLGLPLSSDKLYTPVGDEALMQIREIAQFLAHSDLGTNLNIAQRTRLAAQCEPRFYKAGEEIVRMAESGSEFYIIQGGTVEVWRAPEMAETESQEPDRQDPGDAQSADLEKVAVLRPGQITGELSMFDQQPRSANLVAGPEGATILAVDRERLLALCEDDAVLGTQLLWNIAGAMAQRVRLVNWQLQRAMEAAQDKL